MQHQTAQVGPLLSLSGTAPPSPNPSPHCPGLAWSEKEWTLTHPPTPFPPQGPESQEEDVRGAYAGEDDRGHPDVPAPPHAALHPLLLLPAEWGHAHPAEDRRGARLQGLCQGNRARLSRERAPQGVGREDTWLGLGTYPVVMAVCVCVQRLAMDPRCKGMPLSSFLLKPMQRVTRYPLIIKNVRTPHTHTDTYTDTTHTQTHGLLACGCVSVDPGEHSGGPPRPQPPEGSSGEGRGAVLPGQRGGQGEGELGQAGVDPGSRPVRGAV